MKTAQHEMFGGNLTPLATKTRNRAFRDIQRELPRREREVYEAVWRYHRTDFGGSMTNREIANVLNFDACQVTGRVKRLREKKILLPGPEKSRQYRAPNAHGVMVTRTKTSQSWIPVPPDVARQLLATPQPKSEPTLL